MVMEALKSLNVVNTNDILINPIANQFNRIDNIELILIILGNSSLLDS
jgi:hypothetical protein